MTCEESDVNTAYRFLLVSAGSVVLLGTSARAEIVADDPAMRTALKEYEIFAGDYYAGAPQPTSVKREKKPVKFGTMLGNLFRGSKAEEESRTQSH